MSAKENMNAWQKHKTKETWKFNVLMHRYSMKLHLNSSLRNNKPSLIGANVCASKNKRDLLAQILLLPASIWKEKLIIQQLQ